VKPQSQSWKQDMTDRRRKKKGDQLTPRAHAPDTSWHTIFIAALEDAPNVASACRVARVSRQGAYEHKQRFPEFAAMWDAALESSVDAVEEKLFNVAEEGDVKAMVAVLKAHRPIYREKPPEVTVNNSVNLVNGDDPLDVLHARLNDMRERMIESGMINAQIAIMEAEDAEASNSKA
jgi:hypothetical protein